MKNVRNFKMLPVVFAVSAIIISGITVVLATIDIPQTIADIQGAPSKVAFDNAPRIIYRSRHHYVVARYRKRHKAVPLNRPDETLIAELNIPSIPPPVVKPPRPNPTRYMQNLRVSFTNPNGIRVAGLSVNATIRSASGKDQVIPNLVTDKYGSVWLKAMGPLPVSVAVNLNYESSGQSTEPEWRLIDPDNAHIAISRPLGSRVASRFEAYRVASKASVPPPHKILVYQAAMPNKVVVERTVVDLNFQAPAGSEITCPAVPGQTATVADNGQARLRLPAAAVEDEPVDIRIARTTPWGISEVVLNEYPHDPYNANNITAPALNLISVAHIATINNADVGQISDSVTKTFGDTGKKSRQGTAVAMPDGSSWWIYSRAGIAFHLRPSPFSTGKRQQLFTEAVRIVDKAGGSIGDLTVGSSMDDVRRELGAPDAENQIDREGYPRSTLEVVDSYIQSGLRFAHSGKTINWIELDRPQTLLTGGTTAFVRRGPARLFVRSFSGDNRTSLDSLDHLNSYLARLPSIRLVDKADDADLILDAQMAGFSEDRTSLTSLIPLAYTCQMVLKYSLTEAKSGSVLIQNRQVVGQAGADYIAEASIGAIAMAVMLHQKGDIWKVIAAAVGTAGIESLRKAMRHAVDRCPAIASRTAFNSMTADIGAAAQYDLRALGIDYDRGTITLNAGSADGITVSTPERPFEFDVRIAGQPLPSEEKPMKANYYTASVIQADEHTCLCELRHIERKIKETKEDFKDQPGTDMLRRIPNPHTGLITARACLRFPEVSVIAEGDNLPDTMSAD